MDKLKMHTPNRADDNFKKLAALFPNAVTETITGYDENGKPIEGVYVDRDGNGSIDDGDRYYYKSPAADVIMGLTSKFLYKRWDLSFSLRASLGNYVYYHNLANCAIVCEQGLKRQAGAFQNVLSDAV